MKLVFDISIIITDIFTSTEAKSGKHAIIMCKQTQRRHIQYTADLTLVQQLEQDVQDGFPGHVDQVLAKLVHQTLNGQHHFVGNQRIAKCQHLKAKV